MNRKSKYSVEKWFGTVLNEMDKGELCSIHLDRIGFVFRHGDSREFLDAVSVMEVVRDLVSNRFPDRIFSIVVAIPIEYTKSIQFWDPTMWAKIGRDREPPSLYIVPGAEKFEAMDEEYKRAVNPPFGKVKNEYYVYRSFRDFESMCNGWEFRSTIYILT
ncbi:MULTISPECIES: hypothetical protein [unclassified Chelatococcus]|jgi:hypothetical protein|uniref:hypothetical protein n=1 Tax=unclassified Chelatococcus TaxID=2638111 RepID=UPI001BCC3C36|nr:MULTISPECIES: hypothetical protein [unclassified Chelatococcus]CAH1654606.1 hypothetical protein CHELA20_11129 [Hyphomicrobiales bacterium]MBS7742766.1 hypothetical protein [Chelatococcus sp. HY11]MBX3542116.1 hypothetical protein [Chelatococcus sp.]MCO5075669.1 hypothetical protein [Chelatococcus sp.]CAH1694978.1 hypothetical protein CHELA41_51359 [Hyphomicrobiales bacterium]